MKDGGQEWDGGVGFFVLFFNPFSPDWYYQPRLKVMGSAGVGMTPL
jgi:hypothetical protein